MHKSEWCDYTDSSMIEIFEFEPIRLLFLSSKNSVVVLYNSSLCNSSILNQRSNENCLHTRIGCTTEDGMI